jgi:hypothetical protein
MKAIPTIILMMIIHSSNAFNKLDSIIPYSLVNRYDIVIDEIMADPTPSFGLPNCEWLELRNKSLNEINLQNWRIGKSSATSGLMRSFILKPDSSVIICSSGSVPEMSVFGSVISVTSFPSLSNSGDLIILIAPDGRTIHAVDYSDEWYGSDFKKQGGWSLEMIDLNNPCSRFDNWTASNAIAGGTPGQMNSVDAFNSDITYPKLLRTFAIDSTHLILYFNEPLDSAQASNVSQYSINEGIGNPLVAKPLSPLFDKILLELPTPLNRNKTYSISVSGVVDCVLNEIGSYNHSQTGLFEHADSLDVVVNEILFNPKADGVDYVELYNRSRDILNLKNLYIANLNSLGNIDNITAISEQNYLLFPDDYIILTESPSIVKSHYLVKQPDNIIKVNAIPSMNDDQGHVILMNEQGKIIDRVDYKDDWHFKLIDNAEGVSLERINANSTSNDEQNWHSASSSVGYGTPTYKNSQSYTDGAYEGMIHVEPKIISPNNDGVDDMAAIKYNFDEPGYVANISLFDVNGRIVKQIQRSALCGRSGQFMWDGLNEQNQKLSKGIYIIYTEVFNLKGRVRKFKNTIVVKG